MRNDCSPAHLLMWKLQMLQLTLDQTVEVGLCNEVLYLQAQITSCASVTHKVRNRGIFLPVLQHQAQPKGPLRRRWLNRFTN